MPRNRGNYGICPQNLHFMIWSAIASGHGGTPLKWSGMDCLEEQTAAATFCDTMASEGILQQMTVRMLPHPTQEPTSEPVVIGMRSTDKATVMVWVFHDDTIDGQQSGRTYALSQADYLKDNNKTAVVVGLTPGATYSVTPYNTWSGAREDQQECQVPNQTADGDGKITIPVKRLAETTREAWDGADIMYVLKRT